MTQEDIIYNSVYSYNNYDDIKNNEIKLLQIVNKNKNYLKDAINNYIKDYYMNNLSFNNLFNDNLLKKLIKGHIIYTEMLNLIDRKNKEIDELKKQLNKTI
jgi:hypothetical protein